MKKVFIIAGTRPEVIKLVPVYKEFKSCTTIKTFFITTGQHSAVMIDPIVNFFEVSIDIAIQLKRQNYSLNDHASFLLKAIDKEIVKYQPDLVVVQGDTTSCMVGALAAFYRGIKIAHIEAGLRTYNKFSPYPEEIHRRITGLMTDFHFAPTISTRNNLRSEKLEGHIEVVGNPVIDSLLDACQRINKKEPLLETKFQFLIRGFERMILITGHRRENIGAYFEEIYGAILKLSSHYSQYSFVYLLHTNPKVRELALKRLSNQPNLFLIEPLPYDEMVFLMKRSFLVMTDSGGLQEECPALNIPVIILRKTTERPEGIKAGCSILAGVSKRKIVNTFMKIAGNDKLYRSMSEAKNPYGDGNASVRIVKYLKAHLLE